MGYYRRMPIAILKSGFVGDVGDLSKIIMAKHGLRKMDKRVELANE